MKRFYLWMLTFLLVFSIACKRPEYQTGRAVFEGECQRCNKLNGAGGKKGPDLTTIFQKKDEQLIRTQIYDQRSIKPDGTMPPAKISDHELDMVVQYLKENQRR